MSDLPEIRIGVMGCSGIAERSVIPAIGTARGVTLAGVASRTPERTRATAEKFSVPGMTYEEMIASPEVDAIYISLPNQLHASWATQAISAGKHVLVEKPFTDSVASAKALIAHARSHGRIAMEGLMYRFHPAIQKLYALVNEGRIGTVRAVDASFGFPTLPEGNNRNLSEGGGAILDNLIYPLSFCLGFSDAPWDHLSHRIVPHEKYPIDARGFVRIDWPEFSGNINYGFGLAYRNEITIWGDAGIIQLPSRAFTPPPSLAQTIEININGQIETVAIEPADHFALMIEDFAKKIHSQPNSGWNEGDDILRRLSVIEDLHRKARPQNETPELSIVIPVYNSSKVIGKTVEEIELSLAEWCTSYEILLVNDCSPDDSFAVLKELAAQNPHVRAFDLMRNFGQHNSTMAGLAHARGNSIVMMDDDGQHDPAYIKNIVDALKTGHDVVYVSFDEKVYKALKNLSSWINDKMANSLLEKPEDLYLCSYKGITRQLCKQILTYSGPAPYIDGIIVTSTKHIGTIKAQHRGTEKGESTYSLRKLLHHWLNAFTNFSIKPLRAIFMLGLMTGLLSVLGFIWVTVYRLTAEDPPPGWSTIAVLLLFFGSVQLLSLGLIGEYVGRVLLHINNRPQFIIRDKTDSRDV